MNCLKAFSGTARGSLHILRDVPCEDASLSFSAEDGTFHIVAVADGHGDARCFRSSRGSAFAVGIAKQCLIEFAGFIHETHCSAATLKSEKETLKSLTDSIVARWYDRVIDDIEHDPPTAEELKCLNVQSIEEISEERRPHIYGSTLIAALWVEDMLVLLHQGDGRCDVFFNDGHIEQPIPWDDRCIDTTTTSLCDEDAAERFRTKVIDLDAAPVLACYLGCDGVEDGYRDSVTTMEGVHIFYKDLSCKICSLSNRAFNAYLSEFLPDFSKKGLYSKCGSGDDVSVAGIVDIEALSRYCGAFEYETKLYGLREALFRAQDELNGKIRKHEILQKRLTVAKEAYTDARLNRRRIKKRLTALVNRRKELEEAYEEERKDLEKFSNLVQKNSDDRLEENTLNLLQKLFGGVAFLTRKRRANGKRRKRLETIVKELQDCDKKVAVARRQLETAKEELNDSKEKFKQADVAFNEYDAGYKCIENRVTDLQNAIEAVLHPKNIETPSIEQQYSTDNDATPAENQHIESSDVLAQEQAVTIQEHPSQESNI